MTELISNSGAQKMSRCVFLLLGILIEGVVAVIQTQQTVMAAVGDQASLSCQLSKTKDVLQVTWQKVVPGGEKNLATYTKKFGSRVSAGLEEKMDFQYESLQSCSMVIRRVTGQDEGCYRCLFNSYSEGALIGWTCLKLCELHGPFIDVSRSTLLQGRWVTCSATGQPAPIVTLTVLHQNLSFSHYNTSKVINTNGTITSTTTALLSALSNTQVGCSVSLDSAAVRELLVIVPGFTETSEYELQKQSSVRVDKTDESQEIPLILGVVAVIVVTCFAVAFIAFWRHKNVHYRDDENNKTPLRPEPSDRNKTPSMKLTNEVKQRHSAKKSPESNNLTRFPSVAKKLDL
ncbi:OX-2 membrane glycoprotein-like isoform X2 [Poeciliopsis prolifica]|uniref:OX-2 membrane glycoprotein-like isoform X2 n=1 Tax=Poeciliopsis prolifica TaxID=188132 RepID=UPI0024142673|nr:OX-2 membrane glycoprotein-like isoform X2 [Poeciliopsis prolifica]